MGRKTANAAAQLVSNAYRFVQDTMNPTVRLFGRSQQARVKKGRTQYTVEFPGFDAQTFVPIRSAGSKARAAAMAAVYLENLPWKMIAKYLRQMVDADGISTECAAWIVAKSEGRTYDRCERVNPARIVMLARAALRTAEECSEVAP